jgi:hypothetical protein
MFSVLTGSLIFIGCFYVVFNARIDDGLLGRILLSFSAIAGAVYVYGGYPRALLTAYVLLILVLLWVALRKVLRIAYD